MNIFQFVQARQEEWKQAVESLEVPRVVELYAPNGQLLGTVDNAEMGPRVGQEEITPYFQHFLAKDQIQANFPPMEEQAVLPLADGAAVSGYYQFELTKDGETTVADAKFTFVYGADGQILLHNSGLTPTGMYKA